MIVIVLENAPRSLQGELSQFLFQIKTNIFVGQISGLVREEIWKIVTRKIKTGSASMIYSTNNEQGFDVKSVGTQKLFNLEGILFVSRQ